MNRYEAANCIKNDCCHCKQRGTPACDASKAIQMAKNSLLIWDKVIKDVKKACGCNTALDIILEHLEELEE